LAVKKAAKQWSHIHGFEVNLVQPGRRWWIDLDPSYLVLHLQYLCDLPTGRNTLKDFRTFSYQVPDKLLQRIKRPKPILGMDTIRLAFVTITHVELPQ